MVKCILDSPSEILQDYKFDLEELYSWVKSNNFKLIALQLPEGLKRQGAYLTKNLESELEITAILLADPCFGACDVSFGKLALLGIDAIVHFGHSEIPNCTEQQIPVKFLELQATLNPSKLIQAEKNLKILRTELPPPAKLGLAANTQFITYLEELKLLLEKESYQVQIGAGDARIKHRGQILGCNFSSVKALSAQVDGYMFIGDGLFHPLGISLATNKKVLAFDPFCNTIKNIDSFRDKIVRQRMAAVGSVSNFRNFGILLSTKPGQIRLDYALSLKKKLKLHDRFGTILALDNITPIQIDYLPFDAYINTACPRLVIDDCQQYKKVLITPIELEIILGERTWENYIFDEIV